MGAWLWWLWTYNIVDGITPPLLIFAACILLVVYFGVVRNEYVPIEQRKIRWYDFWTPR